MTRHHQPEPRHRHGRGWPVRVGRAPDPVRRRHRPAETPSLPHPPETRVLMKGNEAMAEAAIQAGCDAYFGYPITPQAELLEWMARRMPEEGRAFVQARVGDRGDQHGARRSRDRRSRPGQQQLPGHQPDG